MFNKLYQATPKQKITSNNAIGAARISFGIAGYLFRPKAIVKLVLLHPLRVIPVISFALATAGGSHSVYSYLSGVNSEITNGFLSYIVYSILNIFGAENLSNPEQAVLSVASIITALLFLFYCFAYVSLIMLRGSPNDYVKVLIESLNTTELTRLAALEALWIVGRTEHIDNPKKLKVKLRQLNIRFLIFNELSIAIAKRCKLSRSVIQGYFLLFNGSVYTNRISKRCQNIDLISYSNRQNISPELDNKENKKIENFIRKIKLHLTSLITTKVEIGDFDIIFRQRSTTAATLSFLNFICNQSSNICHTADVTLLRKLQLCYWNGVIWEHLIGLSCIALVQKPSSTNNQKRLEFLLSGLDQKELLNLDDKDDYFVDWKNEINIAIRQQRFQLLANFRQELSSYKYKKTLIVLYDHSRTVRTLIKKCLSEPDFADFEIFILVGEDQGINFGSKLIDHQLKNEQYEMESDDLALLRRIRRGKLQNLENIMAQFDNVIYVLSAEEWKQTLNPYLKFCKTTIINEYDNKIKFLLVSLNHKRNLFWMIKDLKHNKKLQCIAPGLRNRLEHAVKIYRREPHSLNHWKHTKVLLPDPL